jgi:hypothetical protein
MGAAAPIGDPSLLSPHGLVWREDGEVSLDIGLSSRRTSLLWPDHLPFFVLFVILTNINCRLSFQIFTVLVEH